jgi:predicted MFS family arabinose efflux permease
VTPLRVKVFLSSAAVLEAGLFAVIAPLLPSLEAEFRLSKPQAGLLVAIFQVGWVAAALPVALLATRLGVRPVIVSALLLLAAASGLFGMSSSFGELLAARLLQGAAAVACWSIGIVWFVRLAAPTARAQPIGAFTGAASAGAVLGPAVGGLAASVGRPDAFAVVAAVAVAVAVLGACSPTPPAAPQSLAVVAAAHRSLAVWHGQWIVVVPGFVLGILVVLAPLQLSGSGWGPTGIASIFMLAACAGVVARPFVGRWADGYGIRKALRVLFVASAVPTVLVALVADRWLLAVCVSGAVMTYGVLWGPAMALVSLMYDQLRVPQVLAFPLIAVTVGVGLFGGSFAAGELAALTNDTAVYACAAGALLVAFASLRAEQVTSAVDARPT